MFSAAFGAYRKTVAMGALLLLIPSFGIASVMIGTANAATPTTINLGTAAAASVLAGAGVTNTGPSVLNRDLDTYPTPAITGFPPGTVHGTVHAADAVAQQAQVDLTTAYNAAASAPSTNNVTGVDLGGMTLTQGVYTASSSMALNGRPLTLNGDSASVFIFQAGSTLITGSGSSVVLTGGAQACNVFWQVGSSATLGTSTSFVGNILALTAITLNTSATVDGRALARNASVTLDSNVFTSSTCGTVPGSGSITPVVPGTTPVVPGSTTPVPGTTPVVLANTPVVPGSTTVVASTVPGTTPVVPGNTTLVVPIVPGKTPGVPGTVTTVPSPPGNGFPSTLTGGTLPFTGLPVFRFLEIAIALILGGMLVLGLEYRSRRHSRS